MHEFWEKLRAQCLGLVSKSCKRTPALLAYTSATTSSQLSSPLYQLTLLLRVEVVCHGHPHTKLLYVPSAVPVTAAQDISLCLTTVPFAATQRCSLLQIQTGDKGPLASALCICTYYSHHASRSAGQVTSAWQLTITCLDLGSTWIIPVPLR